MKKNFLFAGLCIFSFLILLIQFNCTSGSKTMTKEEQIARGKYLVTFGGCNDCHSPKIITQMGPVPDTTKLLSGHPTDQPLMPFDTNLVAPGRWVLTNGATTEWIGPWGVSFSANLTPDSSTGLGAWTLDNFIKTMRTGQHLGTGRQLLPPMPWMGIGSLNDEDLAALFAYLQSIPPVSNRVPAPIPPNMIAAHFKMK